MKPEEFKNPGARYRQAPFWSWNDKLDPNELIRQIEEMAIQGWGGFFMHSRVGLVTEYLSKEWMDMVKICARMAQKTGLEAWLYDEDKWPSGYAGGKVPSKDPSFRGRVLILLDPEEIQENDTPISEVNIDNEKKVICKRVFNFDKRWHSGTCYIDTMNPKAVEYFLECTHEEYKKECGQYFGNGIVGIFTDEPCYLRRSGITQPIIPWTDELPNYFYDNKGYSLEENLDKLFYDIGDFKSVRFDFYDTVSKLFLESYTKQYYQWCDNNSLEMTGHMVAEDTMTAQVGRIGSAMPHYEFMHRPGIDKLGRSVDQPVTIKQLTSVADQLGKERTLCEAFGCIGQDTSFFHRKWIADWMAVLGVNYFNPHLSLYSMRGERKRDYPPNFFYQQPWWGQEEGFGDYMGRLSYAAAQGKREVDILIIHPIGSLWSEYSPLHRDTNFMKERNSYDFPFARLTDALISNKIDFHYGDETIMENHAYIKGDKLVVGRYEYSTIIVPPALNLRSKTTSLLKGFAKVAGWNRLIFMEPYPSRVDGRQAELPWIRKAKIVKWTSQVIDILDQMYPDRLKVIDRMTGKNCSTIICQQRISHMGKWILMSNMDEKKEVDVDIKLIGRRAPLILDMFSGDIFKAPFRLIDERVQINAKFHPAGSLLLYYPNNDEEIIGQDTPFTLATGISFKEEEILVNDLNIDNWDIELLEDNVLPLDKITLYLDGKKVLNNQPVFKAWNYFYGSADGTEFSAEYPFELANVPDGEMFAVIEVAENLDKITLNGHSLTACKKAGELGPLDGNKSWKDINFTKVPMGMHAKKGINKLVIQGRKINNINGVGNDRAVSDFHNHRATEVEAVYLVGDFRVNGKDRRKFYIDSKEDIPTSRNITEQGYPFYGGCVEFSQKVTINEPIDNRKAYIEIFDVRASSIELYVNGKPIGVRYWDPYIFDISSVLKEGINEIKVVASTTLFNIMGPNWNADIEEILRVKPGTFVDATRYTEKYTLLPFGIGNACLSIKD